jgi:hypothetical protein
VAVKGQCESEFGMPFFAGLYMKYSLWLKYTWLSEVQYEYLRCSTSTAGFSLKYGLGLEYNCCPACSTCFMCGPTQLGSLWRKGFC